MKLIDKEKLLDELTEIQSSTHMSTCLNKDECLAKRQMLSRVIDIVVKSQEINYQKENKALTLDEVRELKEGDVVWLKSNIDNSVQTIEFVEIVGEFFTYYAFGNEMLCTCFLTNMYKTCKIYRNKPEGGTEMNSTEIQDNGLTKLVMYGVGNGVGCTAANKAGKDISVSTKMTPEEIIKALRKACQGCGPTPCCEFEVLGNMAADLIEEFQEEYDIISAANIELESSLRNVVRCKDCKYSEWLKSEWLFQCCHPNRLTDNKKYSDDYCSNGERKE